MVDKTPRLNDFNQAHRICFDSFLPSHDIVELRNGGTDGVRISLEVFHNGSSTQLFFGENADLTSVVIDENNNACGEQNEITSAIKIHDGRIIKSECIGLFNNITFNRICLWLTSHNFVGPVAEIQSVQKLRMD